VTKTYKNYKIMETEVKEKEKRPIQKECSAYAACSKYKFSRSVRYALTQNYENEVKTMKEWEKLFSEKGYI